MQLNLRNKNIINIYGPTASGKTDLSIKIAEAINGVIINFDTCQFRNYLPALTMCPSPHPLIKEYLFSFLAPGESFSVKDFITKIQAILLNEQRPKIFIGGSGFYLFCLINGLNQKQITDKNIIQQVETNSKEINFQLLQTFEPNTLLHMNDVYRVNNHLKFYLQYGYSINTNLKTILDSQKDTIYNIFLNPERQYLKDRINTRTSMYFNKMCEEVAVFRQFYKDFKDNNIIGYKVICDYLDNKISQEKAISLINLHTAQYAKTQVTFCKNKLQSNITILNNINTNDLLI